LLILGISAKKEGFSFGFWHALTANLSQILSFGPRRTNNFDLGEIS